MARKNSRVRASLLHRYFIPGAHNNHRPHFLSFSNTVVIAGILIFLFIIALGLERLVIRSPSPQIGAVVAAVLVELANADREKNEVATLTVNSILEKAAQMKADDMAEKEYFAHDSPEGITPWHWFKEAGYAYSNAGENLAVFFSDSAEVERAWMNSPLHRKNILGEQFTEIGIALAHGTFEGEETTFVVQMFGLPAQEGTPASTPTEEQTAEALAPQVLESATVAGASAEVKPSLAAVTENKSPVGAVVSPNATWRVLTAPKTTLQYIYIALGALILFAIGFLFMTELKRLHVHSLVRGVSLLALIGVLLWSGTAYFSGELLIL